LLCFTPTTTPYTLSLHYALPICLSKIFCFVAILVLLFNRSTRHFDVPGIINQRPTGLTPVEKLLSCLLAGYCHLKISKNLDQILDRKSTRLNSSHVKISYAVFCL